MTQSTITASRHAAAPRSRPTRAWVPIVEDLLCSWTNSRLPPARGGGNVSPVGFSAGGREELVVGVDHRRPAADVGDGPFDDDAAAGGEPGDLAPPEERHGEGVLVVGELHLQRGGVTPRLDSDGLHPASDLGPLPGLESRDRRGALHPSEERLVVLLL